MRPGSDLSQTLREIAWMVHRRAPERAGVGPIPTTELALLHQVVEAPGSTVGELATNLGMRQPNVSAGLRVLIARGLVTRATSSHDRRRALISPTQQGIDEDAAIAAAWTLPLEHAFDVLDGDHRQSLHAAEAALHALLAAMRADTGRELGA